MWQCGAIPWIIGNTMTSCHDLLIYREVLYGGLVANTYITFLDRLDEVTI
jgi:hypothetical protein